MDEHYVSVLIKSMRTGRKVQEEQKTYRDVNNGNRGRGCPPYQLNLGSSVDNTPVCTMSRHLTSWPN